MLEQKDDTMTLFTLLIVMAFERVTTKTKELHMATWLQTYFARLEKYDLLTTSSNTAQTILSAGALAFIVWALETYSHNLVSLVLHIVLLWACLGCPVTRKTYKRYLQAANRKDFQACSLYSINFGNEGGELSNVGKQLVLVNYRQYASVIIFYVALGLPGMVFYCVIKELLAHRMKEQANREEANNAEVDSDKKEDQSNVVLPNMVNIKSAQNVLSILDWLPARVTAFGFLLVGHFSKGLPIWLEGLFNPKISAYSLLAKVAKASEEVTVFENPHLEEPLQLVKLVKRNIVFLLMLVSLMTLVGLLG